MAQEIDKTIDIKLKLEELRAQLENSNGVLRSNLIASSEVKQQDNIVSSPNLHFAKEISCPKEVRRELEIELRVRPENTGIAARFDLLKFYQIRKNYNDGYTAILDQHGNTPVVESTNGKCDFQFIIQRHKEFLKLSISKGSHGTIANKANSVVAAGDIFAHYDTNHNLVIDKITDQSGSYYIPNTDPHFFQKQHSAKAAMRACGLPTEKFVPFGTPAALVFSTTMRDAKLPKEQETVAIPDLLEFESETFSPS